MAEKNKAPKKPAGANQGGNPPTQPPAQPPPSGNEDIGQILYKYFSGAGNFTTPNSQLAQGIAGAVSQPFSAGLPKWPYGQVQGLGPNNAFGGGVTLGQGGSMGPQYMAQAQGQSGASIGGGIPTVRPNWYGNGAWPPDPNEWSRRVAAQQQAQSGVDFRQALLDAGGAFNQWTQNAGSFGPQQQGATPFQVPALPNMSGGGGIPFNSITGPQAPSLPQQAPQSVTSTTQGVTNGLPSPAGALPQPVPPYSSAGAQGRINEMGGAPAASSSSTLPYGSTPAADRSDTSYGGAQDIYRGPANPSIPGSRTGTGTGAGTGGGTGGGASGGGAGKSIKDPFAGWKQRVENNGLNWDVLVDVYLNPNRRGTWGKFGDIDAEIGQAAENYMDDKLWGDTFYEQYKRGPTPEEWTEHYESRTTYIDGQNYVLHDPLFTGNNQAVESYNQKLANQKAALTAQNNQSYINEPPPNNW